MFSLLILSLVLSAPSAAIQPATLPGDPLVSSPPSALSQPDSSVTIQVEQGRPFDAMEIHPDSDICYKIRAFIFSQGRHPRLLREVTCGPKLPTAKSTGGEKPGLMPLDAKEKPDPAPER